MLLGDGIEPVDLTTRLVDGKSADSPLGSLNSGEDFPFLALKMGKHFIFLMGTKRGEKNEEFKKKAKRSKELDEPKNAKRKLERRTQKKMKLQKRM